MTMTRSQIERLGARLVRTRPPAAGDVAALHELLLGYGDSLEEAVATVQRNLGITPSSRVKTTGTILEKLERYGGSWLKSIQDLAGMRIVGSFDRRGQDELVGQLAALFSDGERTPKIIDRRAEPSSGYRAVHVIVFFRSTPVEIQVRTALQHEWAELFEKLADAIGRGIRYGEQPSHWLMTIELDGLARDKRIPQTLVDVAQRVATTIEVYERLQLQRPDHPRMPTVRRKIDVALAALTQAIDLLAQLDAQHDL